MNKLEKLKLKVVEKSIEAIGKILGAIDRLDMIYATDIYNTVLSGFESLQKEDENNKEEEEELDKCILELEVGHKKVIEIFERGSLENLSLTIEKEILPRYILIQKYYEEKEFFVKNNIYNIQFYKEFKAAGLLKDLNQEVIDEVQGYWEKHLNKKVNPITHLAYYNLTGKIEPRIISQNELNDDLLPIFNQQDCYDFYRDKNAYDLYMHGDFGADYFPEVVLKRVYNQYFDAHNNPISRSDAFMTFFNTKEDLIIKESRSDDGKSVEKINYRKHAFYFKNTKVDLRFIEDKWGQNFIIQKVLKQHPLMAGPHKYSVNTFRMITLRWDNKINLIMSFAKFGADKAVKDNSGGDAISLAISPEGEFSDWGIDYHGNIHKTHPTTGYDFKNLEKVPNFDEYIDFVKKLHNRILHNDYVCWDIAMGLDGKPIFIEMNFRGGVWRYQLVPLAPLFGDFTEDILEKAVKARNEREKKQQDFKENKGDEKVPLGVLLDLGLLNRETKIEM